MDMVAANIVLGRIKNGRGRGKLCQYVRIVAMRLPQYIPV